MHVHGARLHEAVFAPDQIQQLLAPEDAARCAHEGGQEVELLGREIHPLALHDDLEAVPVDLEVARLEVLLPVRGIAPLAPPGHRADPRDQLARREGLGDVVVGAHLEAEDLVPLFHAAGDHDHGNAAGLGILLEPPTDLPAVELRHHDVEQDDVGLVLARALEGVGAIPDQDHVVAFLGQVVADELGHVLLVLDHEDAAARFGRFRWSGLRGAPPCRHRRVGLPHGSCRHGGSVAAAGYSPMTAP